jgi:phage gp36-like protein
MQFLVTTDLNGIIGSNTLTSLRGVADANLDTAEDLALSELDPLYANFDIPGELLKSGSTRNDMLVRMLVHITVYYLFNAVEDVDIPERVDENYRMQIKNIKEIASGKLSSTLDTLTNDETGLPKSNYRWGSDAARDNDIF